MSDPQYEKAKKRVEELKGFYIHLAVWCIVIGGLFAIDAIQGGGWWFFWPALGWGIGLTIHAGTLLLSGNRMARWEDRKIEKYLERAADQERSTPVR